MECHAQIKWYFQCSTLYLHFCKEYLNTASLTPYKELNKLIY